MDPSVLTLAVTAVTTWQRWQVHCRLVAAATGTTTEALGRSREGSAGLRLPKAANLGTIFSVPFPNGFEIAETRWHRASGTYSGHGHDPLATVALAQPTATITSFIAKRR